MQTFENKHVAIDPATNAPIVTDIGDRGCAPARDGAICRTNPAPFASELLRCVGGRVAKKETCERGCQQWAERCTPADWVDPCANAPADPAKNWFCGTSLGLEGPSATSLHFCSAGRTSWVTECADGCSRQPPSVPDQCGSVGDLP